ncbi:methyltransferase [Spiroplasma litorale]|uniref:Methyltransferase n=1 Tax=Spiroplasma litorale TaxID=216942 RepID=A0A0K1W0X0_9MOLU|nr:class I SAM-dependent methyltransferase [Spiroplasma litorale]AKX33969.1 methyltransferase [Spiroplasma litorale]
MKNRYLKLSSLVYNYNNPVGHSIDGDIDFYKKELIPKSGNVLELGCGNGRICIYLNKYNVNIEGLDNSTEMQNLFNINLCNESQPKFINKNVFEYTSEKKYDTVISPNGFMNFFNQDDCVKLLKSINNLLNFNGYFYVDLIFPTKFVEGKVTTSTFNINKEVIKVENFSNKIDFLQQKSTNIIKYYRNNVCEEKQIMELNWYCTYQFINLLELNGFKYLNKYFNFEKKYKKEFNTITIISQKKEGI